ncbi:hypothetical protein PRIPAC_74703, partial [Pristionchus pacificus]|uniref:W02B3.4-like N-terminal domain-containing protein n=1 Tax=Pristionchus pacificus TaxID=54126 RepID=A0A2A6C6V3_PRIPA
MGSHCCSRAPPYLALVLLTIFSIYFHPPFDVVPASYSTTQRAAITLSALPWQLYADSFAFLIPVLIIDIDLLQSIISGASPTEEPSSKLRVAVEERFRGMKIAEKEENLDVIFYSKSQSDRDYWLFEMGMDKRAMRPFEMCSTSLVFLPSDIRAFLEDWHYSRLIECNALFQRNSSERRSIPLLFTRQMADLRDFIKERKARLMLAGGTLLGIDIY